MEFFYKNKDWLSMQYLNNELSPRIIAKRCSVCEETIRRWLKRFNIPCRNMSAALRIRWKNPDYRSFQVALQQGRTHTEETKKKISEGNKDKRKPKMEKSARWKGGAVTDNAFRKRARKIWEQYYNVSLLSHTRIHHIDRNPKNNNIENLEALFESQHRRKHELFL